MEMSFHPPLTLVPLLANYPHSHYSPLHWESHLHTPLFSHSNFWCPRSKISCAAFCTFVRSPFGFVVKVTRVFHASFSYSLYVIDFMFSLPCVLQFYIFFFTEIRGGGGVMNLVYGSSFFLLHGLYGVFRW